MMGDNDTQTKKASPGNSGEHKNHCELEIDEISQKPNRSCESNTAQPKPGL